MKKMIEVKAKHIKNGECGDPVGCPIALALRDIGFEFDSVLGDTIRVFDNCKTIYLPKKAQKFIAKFDAQKEVKPFKFQLQY